MKKLELTFPSGDYLLVEFKGGYMPLEGYKVLGRLSLMGEVEFLGGAAE